MEVRTCVTRNKHSLFLCLDKLSKIIHRSNRFFLLISRSSDTQIWKMCELLAHNAKFTRTAKRMQSQKAY